MATKREILKYPNGKLKFRDLYKKGKIRRHFFYALKPKHHLYLSVAYNSKGEITRYIKHKFPKGYYEYLVLLPNGYLKDKLYKNSPYCKYLEKEVGSDFYLTVHRFDKKEGKFIKRSSEYLKNSLIVREIFYRNGKKVKDKIYKKGKPLKLYSSKKDQPSIALRP